MPDIFTSTKTDPPASTTPATSNNTLASATGSPLPQPKPPFARRVSSGGMLSAFMVRPKGVRFETQESEEDILLFMRQHLVTNTGWVFASLVLLTLPPILTPFLLRLNIFPPSIPAGYYLVLPLLWYLGIAGFVLTNFLKWYFNVYIVTNRRVVDIDWLSLLYKQLSSTQLNKIQDVTYKQGGVVDSFFDFGNVVIQTAGTEENFEFDAVPQPEAVVRQINEILEHLPKTAI